MPAQVELLREVFDNIDTEGKGYFTKDELFFIMESMGGSPTPQELDAVMFELDSDNDQYVDFPEFLAKFYVSAACCLLPLSTACDSASACRRAPMQCAPHVCAPISYTLCAP